jgi:hypothetical protein
MKTRTVLLAILGMIVLIFLVFSRSPMYLLRDAYRPKPLRDVTAAPEYNFRPFAGTVWKTKVKVALADVKTYTGAHELNLLAPIHFDMSDPEYTPGSGTHIISACPPGTRLRIGRLMQDQGAWGGIKVEVILLDGTNAQKAAYLDPMLLSGNHWLRGPMGLKMWRADPGMLDSVDLSAPSSATGLTDGNQ